MMHSIRQRLLFGLLAGLGLVLAASGHVAYRQARTEVNALFDYQLQQTALALRNQNWLSLMFGEDDGDSDLLLQVWIVAAACSMCRAGPQNCPSRRSPALLIWTGASNPGGCSPCTPVNASSRWRSRCRCAGA